uniref:Uncharacterized protein n=1 Tax=Sphaerodactylus townsendi TaxID=933632 RepID=A0ACB8FHL3_9SAUR
MVAASDWRPEITARNHTYASEPPLNQRATEPAARPGGSGQGSSPCCLQDIVGSYSGCGRHTAKPAKRAELERLNSGSYALLLTGVDEDRSGFITTSFGAGRKRHTCCEDKSAARPGGHRKAQSLKAKARAGLRQPGGSRQDRRPATCRSEETKSVNFSLATRGNARLQPAKAGRKTGASSRIKSGQAKDRHTVAE